jgi:tetratricopeptide (TPR) repeat protein
VVHYRLARYADAIANLERAGATHTNGPNALEWFFLAMSHYQMGDSVKAKECYDRALDSWKAQAQNAPGWANEFQAIQAEADALLGKP